MKNVSEVFFFISLVLFIVLLYLHGLFYIYLFFRSLNSFLKDTVLRSVWTLR